MAAAPARSVSRRAARALVDQDVPEATKPHMNSQSSDADLPAKDRVLRLHLLRDPLGELPDRGHLKTFPLRDTSSQRTVLKASQAAEPVHLDLEDPRRVV